MSFICHHIAWRDEITECFLITTSYPTAQCRPDNPKLFALLMNMVFALGEHPVSLSMRVLTSTRHPPIHKSKHHFFLVSAVHLAVTYSYLYLNDLWIISSDSLDILYPCYLQNTLDPTRNLYNHRITNGFFRKPDNMIL
jgi:hypothetical protein